LAAKPAHSGDRQGRKLRRPVWLPKRSAELVLLVCPSRGAVRLKRSSGRRLLRSGSFRHPSSWCKLSGRGHAALGVRRNQGGERPLTRQLNLFRPAASTGRPCRAAVYCWRLNAWLRRFWVWCLAAAWQWFSGKTQPPVSLRFLAGNSVLRLRGNPA